MSSFFEPAHLGYLVPYLILAVVGMLLVLAEAFYRGKDRTALVGLTVAGALASSVASIILYRQIGSQPIELLGTMLIADKQAYVLSALFGVVTAFAALMSPSHQKEHGWELGEYYGVMLLSASGMVMLAHAGNLVTIFLGIETMSIGVYVMTAMRRKSRRGNEAAMKYFLIGAFATGFLVYGMALLYGAAGTASLVKMQAALSTTANPGLVVAGGFMLIVAFGFKVAAVPFHMWAPDAYEGAPTPVTSFMAAAVKAAAIAAMLRVFGIALGGDVLPFGTLGWASPLVVIAAITITIGNITAVRQDNIKRMLAYSSISHAGVLLVGICAGGLGSPTASSAVVYYLIAYSFTTMGAFAIVQYIGSKNRERLLIDDWSGFGGQHPAAALAMTVCLLSLGGMPPTGGFFGKFYIFSAAMEAPDSQLWWLVLIGIVNSAISIYYYLRIVTAMYFREANQPFVTTRAAGLLFVMAACPIIIMEMGVMPGWWLRLSSPVANVRQLAKACGLDPDYIKWTGEPTSSSDASLLAAIKALAPALGIQVETDDDVRGALNDVERNRWDETVPPVVVGWDGSLVIPFAVPAQIDDDWEISVTTESSRVVQASGKLFQLPADSHAWPGGQVHCVRRASIWLDNELGYHRVVWRCGARRGEAMGIAAPSRAYGGPGGPRRWGVFAPVYGLASAASGEAGDLATLRQLFEAVARRGGRYVATLPILAASVEDSVSPYSPVSRHFWNELYLDLARLAGEVGQAAPTAPPIRPGALIDYAGQYRWRRAALDPIAAALLARRGAEIDTWARATDTYDYAAFRALGETTHLPWHKWPLMWRDELPFVQSRADAVANGVDVARFDTHVVAQWAMQRQLEALTHDSVGLYLDLPVGVSLDAYEVWRYRHLFLTSLATGAPPDPLFLGGQNWGLPPLSPIAVRRDHYRYVIRCVRHHMKVAGMLRIDHVMGLFRLYVVPEGRPATDGVYLRYHAEDLLAILALESQRHKCSLVGEDLGTVPDHVRPAMHRHSMFRLHVGQWFLPSRIGDRPGPSPHESVAALNTHDTATFAGWWRGADIDDRHDLKLISDAQDAQERVERDRARAALLAFANHHPHKTPAEDNLTDVERAMVAATADLAASSAEVMLIALDDLALDPVPHNVPGTTTERTNWQRRIERWSDALDPERAAPAATAAVNAVVSIRR